MKRLLLLGIAISAFAPGESPAIEWNPAAAIKYSQKNGGTVLLIRRQGFPNSDTYARGYDSCSPCPVFSITKTLTALTCLSLRSPSPTHIVRRVPGFPAITLRDLLTQTSGISTGYEKLYKRNVLDVRKTVSALAQENPPGQRFVYGPAHYEFIGTILNSGTANRDAARDALTRFLNRIGIVPSGWRTDQLGHIYLSAGALLTPDDLLKLGEFVLNRGKAGGFRPLVDGKKIDMAITGTVANPAYGMGLWLNKAAGRSHPRDIEEAIRAGLTRSEWADTSLSNRAPGDLICMVGSGGQRVYVIPSLRAVIVRLGKPSKFRDPDFLAALFSSKRAR